MKNIIKGLSNSKRAEIAAMAETFEQEGQPLRKVEWEPRTCDYVRFSNQVDGNSLEDAVIYGPIKECGNGSLIVKGYNVYQKAHNRKADTVEVFEVVGDGVIASRIQEKINNVEHYLCVESNYRNPTEGKGEKDAVLFQTGQVAEGKEEIDSCVIVSVDVARSFANSILQTCDEIENERPQEELPVPSVVHISYKKNYSHIEGTEWAERYETETQWELIEQDLKMAVDQFIFNNADIPQWKEDKIKDLQNLRPGIYFLNVKDFTYTIEIQPQEEAKPKCIITLLEKEHLPGAFIVEVLTPECTHTIHHYSDKSRMEYVDDLVRQLEFSGVTYVVKKLEDKKSEQREKSPQVAGTTSEDNNLDEIVINKLRERYGLKPIADGDTPLKKMD